MTFATTAPSANLEIGGVLARSVAIIRKKWVELTVLTLGLGFVPQAIFNMTARTTYIPGNRDAHAFAVHCAATLGFLLLGYVAQTAVISVALESKRSSGAALASALKASPRLAPLWLVGLIGAGLQLWLDWCWTAGVMGMAIGTVLIGLGVSVIDFLLVATVGLFTPVVLVEGRGFGASLVRAARLMDGARWKVVGLYLLTQFAVMLTTTLGVVPRIWLARSIGANARVLLYLTWPIDAAIWGLEMLWPVVMASAFLSLCRVKDGSAPSQVASIFD